MRKIHDRTDPACRLHGVTSAATKPPRARTRTPPGERGREAAASPQRGSVPPGTTLSRGSSSNGPLGEMTGFRTRKGVVLLYEPDLLDAWIGRRIEKLEGGSFADMESGKTLNKQEGKSYKAYLKRHKSRNEEARLADKLFHIKYLPLQADETRAYIARFPAQVKNLLPKARKIRNKLRREGGGDCDTTLLPAAETTQSEVNADTPPDWGGDSQTDEDTPQNNWPWGEQGPQERVRVQGGLLHPSGLSKSEFCSAMAPGACGVLEEISADDLSESMQTIASTMGPWKSGSFRFVKKLEEAARNHGRVDMMESEGKNQHSVAVKRMPNSWIRSGPEEFADMHPHECENPWRNIGVLAELKKKGYSATCELLGVFCDEDHTYAVTTLATGGDMFSWCENRPHPTPDREAEMLPLVAQTFSAVEWLHALGIAHRDLSLENLLLTGPNSTAPQTVKLIDFGMAHIGRVCPPVASLSPGKPSYQAPELHLRREYDGFQADSFALGVVVYAMAVGNYPWTSTKPGRSRIFDWVSCHGIRRYFQRSDITKFFSSALIELMAELLLLLPSERIGLVKTRSTSSQESQRTVWDCKWLSAPATQGKWRAVSSTSVSTMATETESDAEEAVTGCPASGEVLCVI
ncbi:SIK2 [Symbiodinium sp. KB8]|nr:SIK2 [Symbiodinium sp. KB8]